MHMGILLILDRRRGRAMDMGSHFLVPFSFIEICRSGSSFQFGASDVLREMIPCHRCLSAVPVALTNQLSIADPLYDNQIVFSYCQILNSFSEVRKVHPKLNVHIFIKISLKLQPGHEREKGAFPTMPYFPARKKCLFWRFRIVKFRLPLIQLWSWNLCDFCCTFRRRGNQVLFVPATALAHILRQHASYYSTHFEVKPYSNFLQGEENPQGPLSWSTCKVSCGFTDLFVHLLSVIPLNNVLFGFLFTILEPSPCPSPLPLALENFFCIRLS